MFHFNTLGYFGINLVCFCSIRKNSSIEASKRNMHFSFTSFSKPNLHAETFNRLFFISVILISFVLRVLLLFHLFLLEIEHSMHVRLDGRLLAGYLCVLPNVNFQFYSLVKWLQYTKQPEWRTEDSNILSCCSKFRPN